ncbi:MAG: ParB N-terminal domain-containing protein [Planctomycetota bacterium]
MATKKTRKPARKTATPSSRGLAATELAVTPSGAIVDLVDAVRGDGAEVLATYRDPLAGRWLLLAALPIEIVQPTPYQRDNSPTHLKRLVDVIDRIGAFLDPIIATREGDKTYWTPNGSHRLSAMKKLGAKCIVALVVPETEIALQILALNTEKSHNLKEKSLEVIRMARAVAADTDKRECDFALEFEDPVLLTLGTCYERDGRFSGGAYRPALRVVESFLDAPLADALATRDRRGALLHEVDAKVSEIIAALKKRGIESPYLRSFVTARINPVRFKKDVTFGVEDLLDKMLRAAGRFDVGKVDADDVKAAAGYGGDED